jgi:acetolactate decarboxylase
MRKYIALGLLLSSSISLLSAIAGEVQHQGSLKKMHHGEFQGVVDLSLLAEKPFLTAVGPLENLSGEFTAFKGRLFSTQAAHGQLKTLQNSAPFKASFLVWTHSENWTILAPIQFDSDDLSTLESRIESAAKNVGIDLNQPFAFALHGKVGELEYHVLAPTTQTDTRKNHKAGAFSNTIRDTEVTLVGFYSNKHAGVFTHKGARVHVHVVDGVHTGHVDSMKLNGQMKIEFAIP